MAAKTNQNCIYIYGSCLACYEAFFFSGIVHPDAALYLTIFLALLMPNSIARALLASSTVWMHEAAALTCLPLYFTIE